MGKPEFQPQPADRFEPVYRRHVDAIREPAAPLVRLGVRERLIRCLWFDQEFDDTLRTESGEKITVLSPGWWNLESGPDFKHASIRFSGGKSAQGDIEVHLYAAGWTEHKHHHDPAYNNVILHVVMWNNTGCETTTAADGREIPILALDRYVGRALDELTEVVSTEDYPHSSTASAGRCQELLRQHPVDPEWIGQFLDHAGDERMIRKSARFAEMPEAADPENLLYISLMEAAGFKKNKKPMGRLARLVPLAAALRILTDGGVATLQAAMLGMAGLLPQQLELAAAPTDPETAAYLSQLRREWDRVRPQLDVAPMEPSAWTFSGTRPVNYPTRRIAGITRLIEKSAAIGGLLPMIEQDLRRVPNTPSRRIARSTAAKHITAFLSGVTDDYWSRRTTFGGKKLRTPTKLIGTDRAAVMFVDAVVPILLNAVRARQDRDLENRLHRAFATLPPLLENSVLRFIAGRIFGGDEPAASVVTSARRQQGLLQLFRDYCESDTDGCRRCAFAKSLDPA